MELETLGHPIRWRSARNLVTCLLGGVVLILLVSVIGCNRHSSNQQLHTSNAAVQYPQGWPIDNLKAPVGATQYPLQMSPSADGTQCSGVVVEQQGTSWITTYSVGFQATESLADMQKLVSTELGSEYELVPTDKRSGVTIYTNASIGTRVILVKATTKDMDNRIDYWELWIEETR